MNDLNDKILTILASMTVGNENLVIEKREIIDMADDTMQAEELDKRIEALEVNDMIVVRYSDAESYCLALRPKGRINAEKIKKAEIAAAMAEEEAALSKKIEPPVETRPSVEYEPEEAETPLSLGKASLAKIALICAGSSFLGGLFAAIVAFLLAKLG